MTEYINISEKQEPELTLEEEKTSQAKRPGTLLNLKQTLTGTENQAFVPDVQIKHSTGERLQDQSMSEKSGRGPAPLPRNSGAGSHTSSDEDHM